MKEILKRIVISLSAISMLVAPSIIVATPSYAADIDKKLCEGANLKIGESDNCDQNAAEPVNNILTTVINIFSIVVGVVSVIMIIIGGLKYITSGGESGNVTGAKNTILYAIIGLVVVALAQVIVRFVLSRATV